ncbi:MAG: GNAT family N-acetyltransferase [Gammaproteobacteria bacterium]
MTDDGGVRTRTITDYGEFAKLGDAWDSLVERSGIGHPFVDHAWICAWWAAFGKGKTLHVITVMDGETLIGAAPLMVTEQRILGLKACALESIANDHTPRFDLVVAPDHAALAYAAIWRHLTEGRAAWDLIQLRQLPVDSMTIRRLKESAKQYGLPVGTWNSERSPYVTFDGTWDDYFSGLGYNHKRNVGKGLRRLQREGEVELEVVSTPEALDDALTEGMRIEALAWKEDAGTAMLSRADVQAFYESFARDSAERGMLRLFFLVHNGKRIAFSYGLQHKRTIFVLKGGYDPEFARYSPYNVLYALVFQHGFSADLAGYDFLGHDEPFKMKWTNTVREHCWIYLFSRSLRGRLLHYLKFNIIPRLRNWLR